jgi:hypothetical protein
MFSLQQGLDEFALILIDAEIDNERMFHILRFLHIAVSQSVSIFLLTMLTSLLTS